VPNVYFAKFNINEQIYNVYAEKGLMNKLLLKIYEGLNTRVQLKDSDGTYKFITLDKNPDTLVVNGRVVLYAPGTHVSYDPEKDDITEREDDKMATYITFSFDIKREIIGFVPKRNFGRNQFINKFKDLVEACTDIGDVEIILEKDIGLLQEKLEAFEHVKEVNVSLIPPNDDEELFNRLFSTTSEEIKGTHATKFRINLTGTVRRGINIFSGYIQKLVTAVGLGYGDILVVGKNRTGEELTVKSDDAAPFTKPIFDNDKDSIPAIAEKTRAGATQLLAEKARRPLINDGERT
jgi:hypothetical protein